MKTIGFVGTGAITEAVVTGLMSAPGDVGKVLISPRNAERAAALAAKFERVEIASDNQSIVDQSDIVCLAVRPQLAEEILKTLTFSESSVVISFIATYSVEVLEKLASPAHNIYRMVPIPTVAKNMGPVVISPPNPEVQSVFEGVGTLVAAQDDSQLQALWSATAMMSSYFQLLDAVSAWLKDNNLPPKEADAYVGSLFHALADTSLGVQGEGFSEMAVEYATPSGLNEQLMRELKKAGNFDDVQKGLSLILDRLMGKATFEDGIS